MKTVSLILNALSLVLVAGEEMSERDEHCVTRFEDNGVCACSNRDELGVVTCNDDRTVEIQPCYCIGYASALNSTVVGECYYSCLELFQIKINITTSTEFNANVCEKLGPLNRVGLFCGQCKNSYGLAAYSFQLFTCIPCQDYGYENWLKYFAVALLPLTVFYVVALLLRFNITSSSLNGTVLVIQCITSHVQMVILQENQYVKQYSAVFKAASSIFGVLNLDFFRMVYPPFCIHPKANIPDILALDYIVAVYPFLLIFITYLLVTAYDRRCRLLLYLWKPFKMCFGKAWNIRASLIQIIATFILLSYAKILGSSFEILFLTLSLDTAHSINGLSFVYVSYDAATPYFGIAHLPYVVLALCFGFLATLPLLLLALYPCGCFQRCLNCCGGRCLPLHVFMDAFQGCYRTHPRDMRYFSALYLLLRVLMLALMSAFPTSIMLYTSGILSLAWAALVAVFQPYKVKTHNTVDAVLLLLMGIYFVSYHAGMVLFYLKQESMVIITVCISFFALNLIVLYFLLLLSRKLLNLLDVAGIGKAMLCCKKTSATDSESIEHLVRDHDPRNSNERAEDYPPLLETHAKTPTYW